jgi:hypothetical protein
VEHEVVGSTCNCDRVELDRAQTLEDFEYRIRASLERARRREPVACDEKAPRVLGGDVHARDAIPWAQPGRTPPLAVARLAPHKTPAAAVTRM